MNGEEFHLSIKWDGVTLGVLSAPNSGQHHRLDVTLHRVHRAMDKTPLELREDDLFAVQLGEARAPERAVQVEAGNRTTQRRTHTREIRQGRAGVRRVAGQLDRR